jgi:exodeoxyribonuclease VII large subunit
VGIGIQIQRLYWGSMTANFFEFQAKLRKPRSAAQPNVTGEETAVSVSELTAQITRVINTGMPAAVLVRGELSNVNRNKSSGHLYFTLKDSEACIECVMFRSEAMRLKFQPEDGMEILAAGRIGVYPQRGRYQLYANTIRPLGQGALELAFQQVRRKLEAEGLFAAERKKPLPAYPLRIVVVTSREAAALHDILKVLRRFAWMRIMIYPVPVQGDGAGLKIAAALQHLNATIPTRGGADVILLARGGGSLEDLWSFNEEVVARAIVASHLPVVSGIGHEVDVSIADLVADHHAHTPTEAAQVVTAQWRGAADHLDGAGRRLARVLGTMLSDLTQRLRAIERHEAFRRPTDRVNMLRQLLDDRQRSLRVAEDRMLRDATDRIQSAMTRLGGFFPRVLIRFREMLGDFRQRLDQRFAIRLRSARDQLARSETMVQEHHPRLRVRLAGQKLDMAEIRVANASRRNVRGRIQQIDALARQLDAVSTQSVLRRGYTMTTRKKDGLPLRSASQVKPGDKLTTRFADGQVESIVEDSKQLSLFD